jgi:hypothetical protein
MTILCFRLERLDVSDLSQLHLCSNNLNIIYVFLVLVWTPTSADVFCGDLPQQCIVAQKVNSFLGWIPCV